MGWSGIAPGMAEVRLVDLLVAGAFARVAGKPCASVGGAASIFTSAVSGSSQLMGYSGVVVAGSVTSLVDLFVVMVLSMHQARLCRQLFGFLSVCGWSELAAVGEVVCGG